MKKLNIRKYMISGIDIEKFNKSSKEDKVKLLYNDFKYFMYFAFKELKLVDTKTGKFASPSPIQYDISDFLQEDNRFRMIQSYRGIGKTLLTSIYVVWRLWKNPNYTFIIVSASQRFSEEIGKAIKDLINTLPLTKNMDTSKSDSNSANKFNVATRTSREKGFSVKIVGIFSQMTGTRVDEVISDDVEIPENSETQSAREKLMRKTREYVNISKSNVGVITYLGTPQSEDSIYNGLHERGFITKTWPSRYPNIEDIDNYKGTLPDWLVEDLDLDPSLAGEPINPSQHDNEELLLRQLTTGMSSHRLQYMLDTILSDLNKHPLKTSDLIVMDLDYKKAPLSFAWTSSKQNELNIENVGFRGDRYYSPMFTGELQWEEYEGITMSIDPSGKGDDETGYAIVALLAGRLFILDCGGLSGGYSDESMMELCNKAKEFGVNKIVVESNMGEGMYTKNLEDSLSIIYPCEVVEVRQHTNKQLRIINSLEPVFNRHKVVINKCIIERELEEFKDDSFKEIYGNKRKTLDKTLMFQLTRLTKEKKCLKFDDRIDALAIAIQDWTDNMNVNNEDSIDNYKKELGLRRVQSFLNEIERIKSPNYVEESGGNWLNM